MSYLTLQTDIPLTIQFRNMFSNATFEYSLDTVTWNSLSTGVDIYVLSHFYIRGVGNEFTPQQSSDTLFQYGIRTGNWGEDESKHTWSGNLESLIDYIKVDNGEHPILSHRCFYYMFSQDIGLYSIDDLEFPSDTLYQYCYSYMFSGCTSLVSADIELPATTLANQCYAYMFTGCTSLIKGPDILPAMTLYNSCYYGMFSGCSSFADLPELPATTLERYCYRGMFAGCAITEVPDKTIEAIETLAYGCCHSMFMNCKNLVTAKVPNIDNAYYTECYYQMFYGCSALVTTPRLPADNIGNASYRGMFQNCTGLVTVLELPATRVTGGNSYYDMFNGCTSLVNVPDLPATVGNSYCYYRMFYGCTSLKKAPNIALTSAGTYQYAFCSMFYGCTSLKKAPTFVTTAIGNYGCDQMFSGCTSLVEPPDLSRITAVGQYGYRQMFNGCTSLKELPDLPDPTLTYACYYRMFRGCTSIKVSETQTGEYQKPYRIPSGTATGTTAGSALQYMFENTGGTFTGTPTINTTYYLAVEVPASKPIYVGVNGKAREVTDMYVGVNGKARKVTAVYVGVNGKARKVFGS